MATAFVMVVLEAMINSYLFAKGSEFGLLGGLLLATVVSFVNVGVSLLLGYMARYIHCRNWIAKLGGFLAILVWMGFAFAANLAVAHFREVLEAGVTASAASREVIPQMLARPFALADLESWVLMLLGGLISTFAFRKGWHADDAYPGYGRVSRALDKARAGYVNKVHDALEELADTREKAIENLHDVNEMVRSGIGETVDSLFGQATLGAHLQTFLEQCDVKVSHLLAVYRDANRAKRSTPPPASFEKSFAFQPFVVQSIESARRIVAEDEAAKVTATVDATVRDIYAQFEAARSAFETARDVASRETSGGAL
jgi:hypothetical protein